jgi:hypothetical protein
VPAITPGENNVGTPFHSTGTRTATAITTALTPGVGRARGTALMRSPSQRLSAAEWGLGLLGQSRRQRLGQVRRGVVRRHQFGGEAGGPRCRGGSDGTAEGEGKEEGVGPLSEPVSQSARW